MRLCLTSTSPFKTFIDGVLRWLHWLGESHLSDRYKCIRSDNKESYWKPIIWGVPQGSALGFLWFSVYVNDSTTFIRYYNIHLYADDLKIYTHRIATGLPGIITYMNTDINAISTWAFKCGLKLKWKQNSSFCDFLLKISRNNDFENSPRLVLNNCFILYSNKVKNLGLTLTKHLSWSGYKSTL